MLKLILRLLQLSKFQRTFLISSQVFCLAAFFLLSLLCTTLRIVYAPEPNTHPCQTPAGLRLAGVSQFSWTKTSGYHPMQIPFPKPAAVKARMGNCAGSRWVNIGLDTHIFTTLQHIFALPPSRSFLFRFPGNNPPFTGRAARLYSNTIANRGGALLPLTAHGPPRHAWAATAPRLVWGARWPVAPGTQVVPNGSAAPEPGRLLLPPFNEQAQEGAPEDRGGVVACCHKRVSIR